MTCDFNARSSIFLCYTVINQIANVAIKYITEIIFMITAILLHNPYSLAVQLREEVSTIRHVCTD